MSISSNNLAEHLENYNVENTALHRKLQTNVEAIRILRKELDKYRAERDQFKLMAETIQLRYCAMKSMYSENADTDTFLDSSSATKLLHDMREKNMKLSTELEKTKEKLLEKEGDIEALRQEKRDLVQRLEAKSSIENPTVLEAAERQNFIGQMEEMKRINSQLKFDLHSMLDDKSEIFLEMEAYKAKARRLQEELDATNRGNMVESAEEIDRLLLDNKQLKDRTRNLEKDLEMAREIIIKYKKFVESQRKNCNKVDERPSSSKDNQTQE